MLKISFFHRNEFHNQIYPKMAKYMSDTKHVQSQHIRRIGTIEGENVLEYEREIEKIWDNIDVSDSCLSELIKRYPEADLVRLVYADRNCNFFPRYLNKEKLSYESQLKYLVGCVQVFEQYLEENDIDLVVSDLSIGIADVFRYVCERSGVKYLTIRSSKLFSGLIFSDPDYDTPVGLYERYNEFLATGVPDEYIDDAIKHIEGIRNKVTAPGYMEVTKQRYRAITWERIKSFIINSKRKISRITSISFDKSPVQTSLKWNLNKIRNIKVTKRNKEKWFVSTIPKGTSYYVFTLQYEPENSTAIRSFPFSNQLCVIENIAKALPLGVYLVVKEHKGNQGYRKPENYRDIWYLPNVMLVSPEYPVNELINKSLGVITLTSRMGWEAIVLGKTVIGLGKTFYSQLNGINQPQTWSELRSLLSKRNTKDDANKIDDDKNDLLAFSAAYLSLTYEGKYVFKGEGVTSQENIRHLSEALISEYEARVTKASA